MMAATAQVSYQPQPQQEVQVAPPPSYVGAQPAGPSVAPASLALPGTIYTQPTAAPLPAVTATAMVYSATTAAPHGFATTATPQMGARMLPAPFPSLAPMGPPASTVPLKLANERIPAFVSSITAATAGLEILEARPTVTAGVKSASTTAEGEASAKKVTGTRPKVKRQEVPAAKEETTAGTTAAPTTAAQQQQLRRRRRATAEGSEEESDRQLTSDETAAKKKSAGQEETPTGEVTLE